VDYHILILIGVALLLIFLIIKLVSKTLFRIIGIALITIGLGIYIFQLRSKSPDSKLSVINTLSIDEIQLAYCRELITKDDSVKCTCIVDPICADMKLRFTETQLNEMKGKKIKFYTELLISAKNQRSEIMEKLKANDAEQLFDEFIEEIKKMKQ